MNTKLLLKTVFFTPGPKGTWGLPLLCKGSPGTAKTSIIEDVAEEYKLHTETVIASLREPSDFLGLPIPTQLNGHTELAYLAPTWAQRLARAGRGVAFLDELSTAAPSVQNALLRVVLDRYIGDLHLPCVRFIAAMNNVDETAGGYELATALANRFIHLDWEAPSLQDWQSYLMGAEGESTANDTDTEEARVLELWDSAFAMSRGVLAGFVQKAPHMIHVQPKAEDPAASKAWPSRRSWEMAARAMAGAKVHNLGEVDTNALLAGCVGNNAMAEFIAYRENVDMPDPEELLDGGIKWKFDKRLDRTLAVLASCTALVLPTTAKHRASRAAKLWEILGDVADKAADCAITHAAALSRCQLGGVPEARSVMLKLGPVMHAAGMLR